MGNHLTESDLAVRFGVTVRTLQKWRRLKTGPAWIVIGKNTIRYREEDIRAYEEECLRGVLTQAGSCDA
ncbi:DNA-binding protein [Ralstonia phage UAM5]|nr:DNA-binding protein [Ralstonia phage UAM5]